MRMLPDGIVSSVGLSAPERSSCSAAEDGVLEANANCIVHDFCMETLNFMQTLCKYQDFMEMSNFMQISCKYNVCVVFPYLSHS